MRNGHRLTLALAAIAALPALSLPLQAETCERIAMNGQFLDDMVICASSVLPPQGANTYGPANLGFLGPQDQAWCEGSPGDGVGESVTLFFRPDIRFRTLIVGNGYQKNATTFSANNRVRHARLRSSDGMDYRLELADSPGWQRIALPRIVEAHWFSLTIESVWRGERWPDTCISFVGPDLEELNYEWLETE